MVQPQELPGIIRLLGKKISLVVTDSQAFHTVNQMVPPEIRLTSFSILFARYKGQLTAFLDGALKLKDLKDGDPVLISEGCTHHRQCNDIGTVKLPNWIRKYSGAQPDFHYSSGKGFPDDLSPFKLIVHCGACMLNPPGSGLPAGRRPQTEHPHDQLRHCHSLYERDPAQSPGPVPGIGGESEIKKGGVLHVLCNTP